MSDIQNALVDLAIATTTVRRAHRIRSEADIDSHIYHYTNRETFFTIFPDERHTPKDYKSPKMLLSPTELLNDPNEGTHFFDVLGKELHTGGGLVNAIIRHRLRTRVMRGLSASEPLVFIASLSMEADNLNLWRFYGGARGVSFGVHRSQFDVDSDEGLSDDDDSKDKLYRVKYGEEAVKNALTQVTPALTRLREIFDNKDNKNFQDQISNSATGLLATIAYLFKTKDYEAERECRLLRIRSINDVRSNTRKSKTIGGIVKLESNVEFIHDGPDDPVVTLGPQFDAINPERGQTLAIDRMRVALASLNRQPVVKLSDTKFRVSDDQLQKR